MNGTHALLRAVPVRDNGTPRLSHNATVFFAASANDPPGTVEFYDFQRIAELARLLLSKAKTDTSPRALRADEPGQKGSKPSKRVPVVRPHGPCHRTPHRRLTRQDTPDTRCRRLGGLID